MGTKIAVLKREGVGKNKNKKHLSFQLRAPSRICPDSLVPAGRPLLEGHFWVQ
jgi:hypothetical protein